MSFSLCWTTFRRLIMIYSGPESLSKSVNPRKMERRYFHEIASRQIGCLFGLRRRSFERFDVRATTKSGHGRAEVSRSITPLNKSSSTASRFSVSPRSKFDVDGYCEAAKHYDFTWFEMQHSTLEFKDVEEMIAACPHAGATPMIRLPDAQEWHIQHTTDIGALGVVVPTVDDVDRAREAAKWSRYPPVGRRSAGSGTGREHLGHQRHQLPPDDQ